MAYILQKGDRYCFLDNKNKVNKTQDIDTAIKFTDIGMAYELLSKARKKLKGFKVIDLDMGAEEVESKTKHRGFTEGDRKAVYNKCQGKCAICGKFVPYDEFTVDHIIPLEKGGTNAMVNLQCAHAWCNLLKSDDLMEEVIEKMMGIILHQTKVQIGKFILREMDNLSRWRNKT